MAPFDARNEIERLRYEMIDKLSAQDVRIERSLNEATECVVEAKDAARLSSEASKQSIEAQTKAKEAADRSIELLIRFEKAMAEQTERMRQGAEEFRQMREWMREKSKECAGHVEGAVMDSATLPPPKRDRAARRGKRSSFRWQHCTECGHEGIGLAVLHLQDCFPCPVCKHSTVRRYGSPNSPIAVKTHSR